jgi:hypothetical protein
MYTTCAGCPLKFKGASAKKTSFKIIFDVTWRNYISVGFVTKPETSVCNWSKNIYEQNKRRVTILRHVLKLQTTES